MSAPLRRRVALLEALLAAEIDAREKAFRVYNEMIGELVTLKMRNEAAVAALVGKDYFDGQ